MCQEQEWHTIKSDDIEAHCKFFQKTQSQLNDDYRERTQKRSEKRFKPKEDDVDMENPPIPDYHDHLKLYCPECTREHTLQNCDSRNRRGGDRGKSAGQIRETDWGSEQNPAFLQGRARRMAKFRYVDRNQTRLGACPIQGSFSKDKSQKQRDLSKSKRQELLR